MAEDLADRGDLCGLAGHQHDVVLPDSLSLSGFQQPQGITLGVQQQSTHAVGQIAACPVTFLLSKHTAATNPRAHREAGGTAETFANLLVLRKIWEASSDSIPAGACGIAKYFADSEKWEIVTIGDCCPAESESDSPSESESQSDSESESESDSESESESQSESDSESDSESESQSESESESQSESDSESESGSDDESDDSDDDSYPSYESDKNAIVPADWSHTGYVALSSVEMPEVRFEDVFTATISDRETFITIDPQFAAVCEDGSIQVCGLVPEEPVAVGATIVGDAIRLRLAAQPEQPMQVVVRLTGIRRRFAHQRFPVRTRAQFLQNERWLRGAYQR